jgi:hypothetical protein
VVVSLRCSVGARHDLQPHRRQTKFRLAQAQDALDGVHFLSIQGHATIFMGR